MSFLLDPFLAFMLGLIFSFFSRGFHLTKKTTFTISALAISLATAYSILLYVKDDQSDFLILDMFAKILPIEQQFGSGIILHPHITHVTKDLFPFPLVVLFYALYFLWFFLGFKSARQVIAPNEPTPSGDPTRALYIRIGGLLVFVSAGLMLFFFVMVPLDNVAIGDAFGARWHTQDESTNHIFGQGTVVANVNVDSDPHGVAVNPLTHMVYTPNYHTNTLSVINGISNTVLTNISVGKKPIAVAVDLNENKVYVTNSDSASLSVINGSTNTVLTTIDVGMSPTGVAVDPNTHMVYVVNSFSNSVSVINGSTNTVLTTIDVGMSPTGVAVDPNTHMVYVVNTLSYSVSVIDSFTNTVVGTIMVGNFPIGVAVDPVTNMVYVANFYSNTLSIINGASNTVISTVKVGNFPIGVAVDPNNHMVYVTNAKSDSVSVISGINAVPEFSAFSVLGKDIAKDKEAKVYAYMGMSNKTSVNHFSDQLCNPDKVAIVTDPSILRNPSKAVDSDIKIQELVQELPKLVKQPPTVSTDDLRNMCWARENTGNVVIFFFVNISLWMLLIATFMVTKPRIQKDKFFDYECKEESD